MLTSWYYAGYYAGLYHVRAALRTPPVLRAVLFLCVLVLADRCAWLCCSAGAEARDELLLLPPPRLLLLLLLLPRAAGVDSAAVTAAGPGGWVLRAWRLRP